MWLLAGSVGVGVGVCSFNGDRWLVFMGYMCVVLGVLCRCSSVCA